MSLQSHFNWPSDQHTHAPTTDVIVTTVKNLIISLMNNKTQIQLGSTTDDQQNINTEHATLIPTMTDDISTVPVTEQITENVTQKVISTISDTVSSTMRNIVTTMTNNMGTLAADNTTGTILDVSTSSNNTLITNNTMPNNTVITEGSGSNRTMVENNNTIVSVLETTESNIVKETIQSTLKSVTTTTEKIIDIVDNTTTNILNNGTMLRKHHEQDYNEDNSMTIIIVLGVLLGILILIVIGLFIFYRKYKKCHKSTGYCVTQLKEMSTSSIKTENSDSENINVKL